MQGVRPRLAGAIAVMTLSGCAVVDDLRYPYAGEDAGAIFVDAASATSDTRTLRVSGFVDPEGKGKATIDFSLMTGTGGHCSGEVSLDTASFDVLTTPDGSFLRGSAWSWQKLSLLTEQPMPARSRVLEGRWVKKSDTVPLDPVPLCRLMADLLTEEEQSAVDEGEPPSNLVLVNEGLGEAAGEKAVRLQVTDEDSVTDAWVSLEEPHYFVKMVQEDADARVQVVLSDFDLPAEFDTPPHTEVLDLGDRPGAQA